MQILVEKILETPTPREADNDVAIRVVFETIFKRCQDAASLKPLVLPIIQKDDLEIVKAILPIVKTELNLLQLGNRFNW